MTTDPRTKVAQDLTAIVELSDSLWAEAIAKANDRLMPGGRAMVALGPEASPAEWAEQISYLELRHYAECDKVSHRTCHIADHVQDDDDVENDPLRIMLFWTDDWRETHGYPLEGRRPTIASEAAFIRWALNWAWETEPHFEDFTDDIRRARTSLENLLADGKRNERGVQCFDCAVDLVRPNRDRKVIRHCEGHEGVCTWPHRFCAHDRGGLADEWLCPSCERKYDVESYRRAVSHAHFIHADYLPLEDCVHRTGTSRGSIQGWASKGLVRKRRDHESGRMTYHVADIEARRDRKPDIVALM